MATYQGSITRACGHSDPRPIHNGADPDNSPEAYLPDSILERNLCILCRTLTTYGLRRYEHVIGPVHSSREVWCYRGKHSKLVEYRTATLASGKQGTLLTHTCLCRPDELTRTCSPGHQFMEAAA